MHIRISFICFFSMLLLCSSCKEEVKVELPYEEEKVVRILADMHFAKSAAIVHSAEIRDSMKLVYESQAYIINGITKEEFEELKKLLESNLNLYYDIEKKVHSYLKKVQNERSK